MAYCGQCGFKNPEGAKFCGNCGADLTLQEINTPPPPPVQPAAPPVTPVQPTAPIPPVTPVQPAAPATSQVIIQTAPATPHPMPQAPKSSGSGLKTCLGCGCAFIIISTLITVGLLWWGYSYVKNHNDDISEMLEEWVDNNKGNWEREGF